MNRMRLIDADALLKAIIQMSLDGNVFDRIHEAPTIEPQRTGRWMPTEPDEPCFYRCSESGRLIYERENFCPNCGAERGGQDE